MYTFKCNTPTQGYISVWWEHKFKEYERIKNYTDRLGSCVKPKEEHTNNHTTKVIGLTPPLEYPESKYERQKHTNDETNSSRGSRG